MKNSIFNKQNPDYWGSLNPKEGMRLAFEFVIQVAAETKDNKATTRESKDSLLMDIMTLKSELHVINANSLSEDVCKAIWRSLMSAFESGQFAGMIDRRAEEPGKSIRGWAHQQLSVKAKKEKAEALKADALVQAKNICKGINMAVSQYALATKILNWEGWPKGVKGLSRKKLIEAIREWDKSGEIQRNPSKSSPIS